MTLSLILVIWRSLKIFITIIDVVVIHLIDKLIYKKINGTKQHIRKVKIMYKKKEGTN